jgi:hypothetical protein
MTQKNPKSRKRPFHETRVVCCARVADLADGPPVLSTVASCARCNAAVWIANSSPECDEIICAQCLNEIAAKNRAEIKFGKLTAAQIREIKEFR